MDSFEKIIEMAVFIEWTCMIFLPAMHERYTYVMDLLLLLLAFVNRKFLGFAFIAIATSCLTYYGFLYSNKDLSIWNNIVYILFWLCHSYVIFVSNVKKTNESVWPVMIKGDHWKNNAKERLFRKEDAKFWVKRHLRLCVCLVYIYFFSYWTTLRQWGLAMIIYTRLFGKGTPCMFLWQKKQFGFLHGTICLFPSGHTTIHGAGEQSIIQLHNYFYGWEKTYSIISMRLSARY